LLKSSQTKTVYSRQFLLSILAFDCCLYCQNCRNLLSAGNDYFLHGKKAEEAETIAGVMQEVDKGVYFKKCTPFFLTRLC
jgi:hypothetical protein